MALLRFAPSPTGSLHLGGLRTALVNHLYAKRNRGKWILRIEDTDTTRTVPGSVEEISSVLRWAGLEYDYGPGIGGPHGPYHQSQRLDLYNTYARRLLDSGRAYRCFCSPQKLADIREKLARSGSNSTYDKTCLHLTDEEVARKLRAGEKSIVRFNDGKVPTRPPASDMVFGATSESHASLPTDPILLKSDQFPTYHLASVVDDHEMGITHVFRGEEWLPSFPLHFDLYASLSLTPPQFAHLPILLNPNGTKMSKRNGDVNVTDFIRTGWEPSALLNWLALAGWGINHSTTTEPTASPSHNNQAPDSTTVMTLPDLIAQFDPSSVTHRRNILDPIKLQVLNKAHLRLLWSTPEGLENLAKRVQNSVKQAFPASPYTTVEYLKKAIITLESRIINIYDIPKLAPFLFEEPDLSCEEAVTLAKEIPSRQIYERITGALHFRLSECPPSSWDSLSMGAVLHEVNNALDVKPKVFMSALRHALTGLKTGPGVPEVMKALGKDRTLARLRSGPQSIG